jgi:hypothetical protein
MVNIGHGKNTNVHNRGVVCFNTDIIKKKLEFTSQVVTAINGVRGDEKDNKAKQNAIASFLKEMTENFYQSLDLGSLSKSYAPNARDVGLDHLLTKPVVDEYPTEIKADEVNVFADIRDNNSFTANEVGGLSDGKHVFQHPTEELLVPAMLDNPSFVSSLERQTEPGTQPEDKVVEVKEDSSQRKQKRTYNKKPSQKKAKKKTK